MEIEKSDVLLEVWWQPMDILKKNVVSPVEVRIWQIQWSAESKVNKFKLEISAVKFKPFETWGNAGDTVDWTMCKIFAVTKAPIIWVPIHAC